MASPPPENQEMVELSLYRLSPLGPIGTTLVIGAIIYALFLLNVAAVTDLTAYAADPDGQGMLRIAFILTLILCAALGVSTFDERANRKDAADLEREFGLHVPSRREGGQGMLWATLGGFLVGVLFLGFLVWVNTGTNVWAFATSTGLWFMPMTPLLWMMMARGVYGSIIAGHFMSKLIRDDLTIDLYRHHQLSIFGRIAMRGAFIWLIFVGIILLSFSDQGAALFAQVTLYIAIAIASFNFISTMQPIRKKIRQAKEAELQDIRARLVKARREMDAGGTGAEIPALTALESRIEGIREWPLDLPTAARLPFYILIPVIPWAAGVYAEGILERFLGGG